MAELQGASCSMLASYTLISILDHERWMKEWGEENKTEAAMHLRAPILSAAIAMGIGGITAVNQLALSTVQLDDETQPGVSLLFTCLSAVTGIATMFAMLYIARMDAFAEVDRVERLKEVILKRHTIAELKVIKGLGKKVAYMGKLHHIIAAGTVLATGVMGCWILNVLSLTGGFVLVWRTSGIMFLAFFTLLVSIVSCWLLFRVLVWKPSYEYLRAVGSGFFAISIWSVDHFGKTVAISFEQPDGGLRQGVLTWSSVRPRDIGGFLLLMTAFGAVLTQYAIGLELRLAYCGLQDMNIDLQLLAGTGAIDELRRTSGKPKNSSVRRHTGGSRGGQGGPRNPLARSRRRSVVVHAAASFPGSPESSRFRSPGSPSSAGSRSTYLARVFSPASGGGGGDGHGLHATHISTTASVVRSVFRIGHHKFGALAKKNSPQPRSIQVQPVSGVSPKVLVYEPSVAEDCTEDSEEGKHHHQPQSSLPQVHHHRAHSTSSPRPPPSWERQPPSD
ncbi:unnamed protein product, partial [Pylaiella littoralis]